MEASSSKDLPHINVFETVFAVAAVKAAGTPELSRRDFFGTAFSIGPGLFLTAEHVIAGALSAGLPTLAYGAGPGQPLRALSVRHADRWPGSDVALLHTDPAVAPAHAVVDWAAQRIQVLEDLAAFGFPHAVSRETPDRLDVIFRAYKGGIVTTRRITDFSDKPFVYEVGTPFPLGMSGSPALWLAPGGRLILAGMVLCDAVVQYGFDHDRVEYRSGVVIATESMVGLYSEHLGKHLGEIVHAIRWAPSLTTPPT